MTITPELFFHSALIPFHACVVAIFVLIIAETIGIYIKHRPSNYIRNWLPAWVKTSPLLQVQISRFIVLIFFLINLSFAGYFFQLSFYAAYQDFMSPGVVCIPAFIMAWFFTLFMMHCLDQVIKPNETSCPMSLVGRLATIVDGDAKPSQSAKAVVRDPVGKLHHIRVEPEYGELEEASQVILTGYSDSHYIAKKLIAQQNELG